MTVYLVNLLTGEAVDSAAEYNAQIARGEDVISRIIYAGKSGGLGELRQRVCATINEVLGRLAQRNHVDPRQIYKASVAGNTTMMHLFLGLPPAAIRLAPYIPAINHPLPLVAGRGSGWTCTRPRRSTACRGSPPTWGPTLPPACWLRA